MPEISSLKRRLATLLGTSALALMMNGDALMAQQVDWRADVQTIGRELPAIHPNAFYRVTRERWDSAVAATDKRIGTLNRPQALVALMELVALVRDGHTTINAIFDPNAGVRYYPIELYQFDDGMFIRSSSDPELAGAKVLRIGNATAAQALAAAGRVLPHENEWWLKRWGPSLLTFAEIVHGLGLSDDMERLTLVVEKNGRQLTRTIAPAGRVAAAGHNPNAGIDRSGWTDMRGAGEAPLWLRNPGRVYWSEYDRANNLIYVSYRGVVDAHPRNAEFWQSVFALVDSIPTAKVVIDLRENTGGNSFNNKRVVRGIVARPGLDRADRLFVITGGRTFSAAMNLARDIEQWTNATFVGEPTGNAAQFFGDHRQVRLPASGLTLNVSTLHWPPYDPRDRRDFLAPAVYAPLTSADYRQGVDPVMRAILDRTAKPTLSQLVEEALTRGDTARVEKVVAEARTAVANRFRTPEAEVNALGYRLLGAQRAADAIVVFRSNTRVFPESANVWDSYGEALAVAGQREAAIAAYRKALAIQPDYRSSLEALRRLGQ